MEQPSIVELPGRIDNLTSAGLETSIGAPNKSVKQAFEITGLRSQLEVHEDLPC
jgi:anti-anti-sigma regulatory factor